MEYRKKYRGTTGGEGKVEYGAKLIVELSKQMTADFRKGFTVANLKNMRQFYLTFPKSYALRSELSQTHYRLLMRVDDERLKNLGGGTYWKSY